MFLYTTTYLYPFFTTLFTPGLPLKTTIYNRHLHTVRYKIKATSYNQ